MTTACINTTYALNKQGYGVAHIGSAAVRHNRLAYCQYYGKPLDSIKGLIVRHTCDNRKCVNPLHLELGTQQDNMNDMAARGRSTKKLTTEQVLEIRNSLWEPRARLAKKYGVGTTTINNVLTGKGTYK